MAQFTLRSIDAMESTNHEIVKLGGSELGVGSLGLQVFDRRRLTLESDGDCRWACRTGHCPPPRRSGPYQTQAAIAACHASAPTAAMIDWQNIAALYANLAEMLPTPVVALNRAVAVAMADGPRHGLVIVEALDRAGDLDGYYLLPATRADLLRRLGRHDESARCYQAALALAPSDAERLYLRRRLGEPR